MQVKLFETKKRYLSTYIIFFAFFAILVLQHKFVFMFTDDYGYASLSFNNNIIANVSGTHFNFTQFIEFLRLHYLNATGRILPDGLVTAVLGEGLWFARIVQSAFIALLVFMIFKIINHYSQAKSYIIAIIVCSLYGLLEIFLIDKSIVWFCASAIYLWSLVPMLYGLWMYFRYVTEGFRLGAGYTVLSAICLFWAAASQEQLAVAEIFILVIFLIIKLWKSRKAGIYDIVLLCSAIGGFLFLFLAPAESLRSEALKTEPSYIEFLSMTLAQKVSFGYVTILQNLFSKNFYLYIIALLTAGSFAGYKLLREKRGIRAFNILLTILCLGSISAMIVYGEGLYSLALAKGVPPSVIYPLLTVLLAFLIYGFSVFYYKRNKKFIIITFYGAWISIFSVLLVVIPGLGRMYIPFVFLSFFLMGDVLSEMTAMIRTKQIKVLMVGLLLLVVCFNMINYTVRFYKASGRQIENDQLLRSVSERIKKGEDIQSIDIKLYPNIESNALNPAEGRLAIYRDIVIVYIKEYYDLPQGIYFNWMP